jgi:hypothetical protein
MQLMKLHTVTWLSKQFKVVFSARVSNGLKQTTGGIVHGGLTRPRLIPKSLKHIIDHCFHVVSAKGLRLLVAVLIAPDISFFPSHNHSLIVPVWGVVCVCVPMQHF